jgi:protein SCO1/2
MKFRHFFCLILMITAAQFLVYPAVGYSEGHAEAHKHGEPPAQAAADIGVDERLGSKIPLDITFRDETGKKVRLAELLTGPTLLLPVYYACTNVCNYLQGGLAKVLPKVNKKPVDDYRVLSFSFDETETPEQAIKMQKMYLTAMGVPFPEEGWRFLTGDINEIKRLTDAVGYRFQRKGRDFVHPMSSMVLTGDGTIVRYLYGTSFLAKDISLALLEAREGKTGSAIRTAMDYCFSFDPTGKTYVFNLLRVSATLVITIVAGFLIYLIITGKRGKQNKPEDS